MTDVVIRALKTNPDAALVGTVVFDATDATVLVQYDTSEDGDSLTVTFAADEEMLASSIVSIANLLQATSEQMLDHALLVQWAEAQPEKGTP